jgi:hypothetical protein
MKHLKGSIQDDLKNTLDRSLELKAALERMCADPSQTNAQAFNRIGEMQKHVKKASTALGYTEVSLTTDMHAVTTSPSRPLKTSSPLSRRYPGKQTLFKSLQDSHVRIVASRAGRRLPDSEIMGDRTLDAWTPVHSSYERSELLSELGTEESIKLPFVSLSSGKTTEPLSLPTFEEYVRVTGTELNVNLLAEAALKSADRVREHIAEFKKKMEHLARLSRQPMTGRSSYHSRRGNPLDRLQDKKRGLSFTTAAQIADDKPSQALTEVVAKSEASRAHTRPLSREEFRRFSPTCTKEPADTVNSAEAKLSQIVESINIDRPRQMRRRLSLLSTDQHLARSPKKVQQIFGGIRQVIETERMQKHKLNQRQAEVYRCLLEYFREQGRRPNSTELTVLENVRRLLERGEVLEAGLAEKIRRGLGNRASEASELLGVLDLHN